MEGGAANVASPEKMALSNEAGPGKTNPRNPSAAPLIAIDLTGRLSSLDVVLIASAYLFGSHTHFERRGTGRSDLGFLHPCAVSAFFGSASTSSRRPCAGFLQRLPLRDHVLGPGVPMPLRRFMRDFVGFVFGLAFSQGSGSRFGALRLALQEALDRSFPNRLLPASCPSLKRLP